MLINDFVSKVLSEIELGIAKFNARDTKIDALMPEFIDFDLYVDADVDDDSNTILRMTHFQTEATNVQKLKFRVYCEFHRLKNT